MGTLIASPIASPLASPTRFLSDTRSKASKTSALVDGLLNAWDAANSPASRLTTPKSSCIAEEPPSFPFPSCGNTVDIAQAVPVDTPITQFGSWDNTIFDFSFGSHNFNLAVSRPHSNDTLYAPIAYNVPCESNLEPQTVHTDSHVPGASLYNVHDIPVNSYDYNGDDTFMFGTDDHLSIDQSTYVDLDDFLSFNGALPTTSGPTYFALATYDNLTANSPNASTSGRGNLIDSPDAASQATHSHLPTPITKMMPTPRELDGGLDEHYSGPSSSRKRQRVEDLQQSKEIHYHDNNGAVIGTLMTLGRDNPSKQPYSDEDRKKTKKTRKLGACSPCRMNKKRCDRPDSPYECCKNCKSRVLSMPCFMAKIVDAQLFRDKPSPTHPLAAIRRTVFESLTDIIRAQQRPIMVKLTQDLGPELLVAIARYNPDSWEATYRIWKKDGKTVRLEMPPYCIANMQDAKKNVLEYVANFRSAWLKSVLGRSNDITTAIFDQAQRFAAFNPRSTVSKALDLCAASRIIERDWRVCGGQQGFGVSLVTDEGSPFFGAVPITPMMDAQLDQIVIKQFLVPTREALLAELEAKMTSGDPSCFFEIFLTASVLLSHAEWLLDHSRRNAIRVGAKTRYNYIPRAEGYFHACNTILAYWHHLCRGLSPADMDWTSEGSRTFAKLDCEEVAFMENLRKRIQAKRLTMLQLRTDDCYESELYWCHQMFFSKWTAGGKAIANAKA